MTTDNYYSMSELLPKDRYDYFISRTANTHEFWTLIDADGAFALFEVNNTTVVSLWCDEAHIESNLTPDLEDCIPFKLDIDSLQDMLIPLIRQNNYDINVFPVNSRIGYVVALNEFVNDLNNTLKSNE